MYLGGCAMDIASISLPVFNHTMARKINLHGLLANMALGMCFWSSSVKYFGKGHLGRTVDGPETSQNADHSHVM